jgi:hypothetical protein
MMIWFHHVFDLQALSGYNHFIALLQLLVNRDRQIQATMICIIAH